MSLTIRVTGWAKSRSSEPAMREGKRQGLVCGPVPEYCDPVLLALRGPGSSRTARIRQAATGQGSAIGKADGRQHDRNADQRMRPTAQ